MKRQRAALVQKHAGWLKSLQEMTAGGPGVGHRADGTARLSAVPVLREGAHLRNTWSAAAIPGWTLELDHLHLYPET